MNTYYVEMLSKAKGILFDYNGTLSDDEHVLERAYDTALTTLGFQGLRDGEYDGLVGLSDPDIASSLMSERGSSDISALIDKLAATYAQAAANQPTISEQTSRFVAQLLAEGKKIAVVTGTFRALMEGGLDRAGLSALNPFSVAIEDVSHGKPDPEGFVRGAENIEVAAQEIVGFEDSAAGLEALRRANIPAVGIGPHLTNWPGLIAHFATMDDAARAYLSAVS